MFKIGKNIYYYSVTENYRIPKKMETCAVDDYLYVVAVCSNPVRYKTRYRLFNEFCERMEKNPKVRLYTTELQHGDRSFVTNAKFKIRNKDELWLKEDLINWTVNRLPSTWKYFAWIDGDIEFQRKDWAEETLHALQIYKVVQLFSQAIDLGPDGEHLMTHQGFMKQYLNGQLTDLSYNKSQHPGYAHAMTREAYSDIGGLLSFAIAGSSDQHMCFALVGQVQKTLNHRLSEDYKRKVFIFQERCERLIQRNIGYIPGIILHYFHGAKKNRKYKERWKILVDNNFEPDRDLKRDPNGLWQLDTVKFKLRDDLRQYFRDRNEDSIEPV